MSFEYFSISLAQISSVIPGYTVDSNTIIVFLFKLIPIVLHAFFNKEMSSIFFLLTGVGTVTMINSLSFILDELFVKINLLLLISVNFN